MKKVIPFSPALLILGFGLLWFGYEYRSSIFEAILNVTTIEIPWVTVLSGTGILTVLIIIIYQRKHLAEMIALARRKVCRPLPMKEVGEDEDLKRITE